jgi:O-antigen/teichoic acid export membrane protein
MSDKLKHKVVSGLLWRSLERFGTQAAGFVVSIVLARLLEPKDFGTITLITVFIAIASCFVDGGFATALVQRKEIDELDLNSVFYLSLSVAASLYAALFIAAPWIARFYSEPVLVWILRLLSLSLLIGALNSIQNAVLTREMRFKQSFKASMAATVASGAVGITMACRGYGLWSLVGSALAGQVALTAVLWQAVRWRPAWAFSFKRIQNLFGFGWKLLVSSVSDTFFNNLYNLIIGKLFNPATLGYYSRGQTVPSVIMNSVNGTIAGVIFPALASCQHDLIRVKSIMRRMVKTSCFLVFPMMFGLAAVARPLVQVLFTDKWLPCVPYLQLSCITFAFWPVHVANLQAVMALGRSDIFLTLEVIKKNLVILTIIFTYKFGVMAMVAGQAVLSVISMGINAWPNRRLLNYSLRQQARDILPPLLLAVAMGAIVWGLQGVRLGPVWLLGMQVFLGVVVYLGGAFLLRLESLEYFRTNVIQAFSRNPQPGQI